jgi:carbon monoxide dehydrogenase subunit G
MPAWLAIMKVRLEKAFPVPAPADAAWVLLQDVEAVASCMPGARITERVEADRYKGTVAVKLGPATLTFRGEVEVRDVDPSTRSLRLFAKGTDTTGTSGAAMELAARIEPDGAACRLAGTSETSMSGRVAAFGGRVVNTVAGQVLGQFAANFAVRAAAAAPPPAQSPASELNGMALAWAAFKAWLRSLVTKTHA